MHYSLLTAAAMLAQTQAATIPMPFGMGSVPMNGNTNGHDTNGIGNVGSGMGMNPNVHYYSSVAMAPSSKATPSYMVPSSMAAPSPSMMPQYPALSAYQHKHHHFHMTPVASSASHYINMHMSMQVSASASASASKSRSHIPYTPTPSAKAPSHAPNKALHPAHPHEGFGYPVPHGLQKTPDFTSENGASSHAGGYHGGNGNGFTQTHGGSDDGSSDGPVYSDGSGPAMPGMPGPPSDFDDDDDDQSTPSFSPEAPSSHVNQNIAPVSDMRPESNIAPVDAMAPGSNVAPTQPQTKHGADIGNAFCLGDCYASKEEAKCAQPYTSPLWQDATGCYSCCFTSPDF